MLERISGTDDSCVIEKKCGSIRNDEGIMVTTRRERLAESDTLVETTEHPTTLREALDGGDHPN